MEAIEFGGHTFVLSPEGALFWPDESMLILTDLHLEKGSSFAAKGTFLPPLDTRETLARMFALCERHDPKTVMLLGDSLHDGAACERMRREDQEDLRRFMTTRRVIWVEGNHDEGMAWEGAERVKEMEIGGIRFIHMATSRPGPEVSGHYHPCVRLKFRGEGLRARCFLVSERHLILPAFGTYTGGMDLQELEKVVEGLGNYEAYALGSGRVLPAKRAFRRR